MTRKRKRIRPSNSSNSSSTGILIRSEWGRWVARRRRRMCCFLRFSWCWCGLLLLVFPWGWVMSAVSTSTSSSSTAASSTTTSSSLVSRWRRRRPPSTTTTTTTRASSPTRTISTPATTRATTAATNTTTGRQTSALQIVETETLEATNEWKHAHWTRIVDDEVDDVDDTNQYALTSQTTPQICAAPGNYTLSSPSSEIEMTADSHNNHQPQPQFAGDWQIVVSPDRPHGWTYHANRTVRQRTWLRRTTLIPPHQSTTRTTADSSVASSTTNDIDIATIVATNKTSIHHHQSHKHRKPTSTQKHMQHKKHRQKQKQQHRLHQWMQAIRDDFNFKGFGVTLYKSALVRQSCGAALRLPLSLNFATWEQCFGLPSLSLSAALYSTGTVALTINASWRMEVIQWFWQQVNTVWPVVLVHLLYGWLRGLALFVSLLLFPVTRQPLWLWTSTPTNHTTKTTISATAGGRSHTTFQRRLAHARQLHSCPTQPHFSRTVEERLGVSCSLRYSLWGLPAAAPQSTAAATPTPTPTASSTTSRRQVRCAVWHSYAPQLSRILEQCFRSGTTTTTSTGAAAATTIPAWMARQSAAIGWSFTGPVPDDGLLIAASGLLSLSGLYLPSPRSSSGWPRATTTRGRQQQQQQPQKQNQPPNSSSSGGSSSSSRSSEVVVLSQGFSPEATTETTTAAAAAATTNLPNDIVTRVPKMTTTTAASRSTTVVPTVEASSRHGHHHHHHENQQPLDNNNNNNNNDVPYERHHPDDSLPAARLASITTTAPTTKVPSS